MNTYLLIEVKNLNYNYYTSDGIIQTLKDITFSVEQEEIVSIVGPSGCGKTTLLKIIAGLISIDNKENILNKNNLTLGYMFQKDNLFDWLTVKENIEIGLKIQKKLNEKSRTKMEKLIEKYNLIQFEKYYPNQISGGMRQKVALIRTLAIEPNVLLLDEPFSALDYQNRLKICDEVFNIIKEEKKTAIMVTHDIGEAISCSDKVIILSKRPAKIKKIININFENNLTIIEKRKTDKFNRYFDEVWSEIESDFRE